MSVSLLLTQFLPLKCPDSSETIIITGVFMDSASQGAKNQSKMGSQDSLSATSSNEEEN